MLSNMLSKATFIVFIATVFLMSLTPGPNMMYLISRSICQGKVAGITSWFGIVLGFTIHMLCAAVGLTAFLMAVPFAYELLKLFGVIYLLWLAWQSIRPNASSLFETREFSLERPYKLFFMGLFTSVFNPKIAIFYLSVLPQFISPETGSVFFQSIILGVTQIFIGATVNLLVVLCAARIAKFFANNAFWLSVQRYVMGLVLATLAFKLFSQQRHSV